MIPAGRQASTLRRPRYSLWSPDCVVDGPREPPAPLPRTERALRIEEARADWTYVELATGHNAMMLVPDTLTSLLDGIA